MAARKRKFPDAPPAKTKLPKAAKRKPAAKPKAAAAFVASSTADSKRRRLHPEDAPAERVNFMLPAGLNERMRLYLGGLPTGERMSASYLATVAISDYLRTRQAKGKG